MSRLTVVRPARCVTGTAGSVKKYLNMSITAIFGGLTNQRLSLGFPITRIFQEPVPRFQIRSGTGYPVPVPVPKQYIVISQKMYGDLLENQKSPNFHSSCPILTFKPPNPTKLRSRNWFLVSKVRFHRWFMNYSLSKSACFPIPCNFCQAVIHKPTVGSYFWLQKSIPRPQISGIW